MAAPRKSPMEVKRAPHEEKLSDMHDALYTLGDHAREHSGLGGNGAKLLPAEVVPEKPEAKAAKLHIDRLHKMFKSLKKGKEK